MDDMIFSVMRILMFGVGLLGFAYVVWQKKEKTEALKLVFCLVLVLSGLFGGKILNLKAGPGGIELELRNIQMAAADVVTSNPQLAEQITGEKGEAAVTKAVDQIKHAKTKTDLLKIIPYEVKDSVVTFNPKIEGRVTPLKRSIAATVNFR